MADEFGKGTLTTASGLLAATLHVTCRDTQDQFVVFSSCKRWCLCLNLRSLCIIDEFGKGTLTADGVGLLAAALHQLATAAEPARVVAVTHFSELLNTTYLPR